MSETVRRTVVVRNQAGLHLRPADLFVKTARQFTARVEVVKDHERVDGKSVLALLTLAALENTQLLLEATGEDAAAAIEALASLVDRNFQEDSSSL